MPAYKIDIPQQEDARWWSRGLGLGDPVHSAHFKILLLAPCVTPVIWAISIWWRPSHESCTMSYNISSEIKPGIVWTKSRPEVVSTDDIQVSLTTFAPSGDLPPWLLMNLLIQSCMRCIAGQFLTEIHPDHFQKLGLYVLKSITANPIHFVVIKTKISLQRQNIPRNWPAMHHWKLLKYVNIRTTNSFIIILWIVKNAVQKFEISIISHLVILSSLQ